MTEVQTIIMLLFILVFALLFMIGIVQRLHDRQKALEQQYKKLQNDINALKGAEVHNE